MLFVVTSQSLVASNGNLLPVAIIESDPTGTWFYNGSEVVFTNNSQDYDGQITYTKWYINGVYQSGGGNRLSMPICFVLYDTPEPGNCYQMGQGQSTVSIKLQTRDNAGEWSSTTKTYTVKVHKGRRYFVKDHLGSVRATVDRDGVVIGHDDYYPFGLVMPGRSSNSANPNDNYKFTGHERDDEAGLTLDYMMGRNYDPIIGRFLQIDPMYNQRYGLSPYNYAQNNPLVRIDPNGMLDILIQGANGSSVNIETDLVDVSVDASSLGVDFGGNHSIGGDAVVEAALDLGGIVDPTGVIDAAATAYYGGKGDLLGAAISAVSILPGGDLAKIGKIGKHVDTINNAIKQIGPAGDAGGNVVKQIPGNWITKPAKGGNGGTRYLDPVNPSANNVRAMRGNPNSRHASQQRDYVRHTKNGKVVDKNGKEVSRRSADAHIKNEDFKLNKND
jgi:RHS repeat-associated protein